MEVLFIIILIILLMNIILKGVLFNLREEKWYKSLIPIYNKYTIGKLCDSKKLGLISGIFSFLCGLIFIIYICFEAYLLESGQLVVVEDKLIGIASSEIIAIFFNYILPYSWFFVTLITWCSWVFLMRSFSIKQGATSWWMFIWALFPLIGYIYFIIRKKLYIPNKGLVEKEIKYMRIKK